ncbi:MAG TPA: hypothetical protein VGF95_14580 [Solirubrobacteraceae bacterium]
MSTQTDLNRALTTAEIVERITGRNEIHSTGTDEAAHANERTWLALRHGAPLRRGDELQPGDLVIDEAGTAQRIDSITPFGRNALHVGYALPTDLDYAAGVPDDVPGISGLRLYPDETVRCWRDGDVLRRERNTNA